MKWKEGIIVAILLVYHVSPTVVTDIRYRSLEEIRIGDDSITRTHGIHGQNRGRDRSVKRAVESEKWTLENDEGNGIAELASRVSDEVVLTAMIPKVPQRIISSGDRNGDA